MALRKCVVCERQDASGINEKLLDSVSYRRIIAQHEGLNLAALSRHATHADEDEQADNETRREIARATAAGELTAATPPTVEEWERFLEDIAVELSRWPSVCLRITDRLQQDGMARYSQVFAALVPSTMLHQAIAERPARTEFIAQHWLEDRLPKHLKGTRTRR